MTINSKDFYNGLRSKGINFFTGVPDSLLANFCEYVDKVAEKESHYIAVNEGASVALAMGHFMKSGSPSLVYLQNSGLGNTINPLLSLADSDVYSVPMLLLVGWRGEPGVSDEPQHIKQGDVTEAMLKSMDIDYLIMDAESDLDEVLSISFNKMNETSSPFVILVRKNTFSPEDKRATINKFELSREEAIEIIIDNVGDGDAFVSTTGKASRELFESRVSKNKCCSDFLTVGGMGHAGSIAMGIKLAGHNNKVFLIDGDGAFLMHMGASASIGASNISNFIHVILDNGCHESVGGQKTISRSINFELLSKGFGYTNYLKASNRDELAKIIINQRNSKDLTMLHVMINATARSDLGRPTSTPIQNKDMFTKLLNQNND